jgi:hypothetical protein
MKFKGRPNVTLLEPSEIWYAIEWRHPGEADGWFATTTTADSSEGIQRKLAEIRLDQFEYRIVKKTLTTEVM